MRKKRKFLEHILKVKIMPLLSNFIRDKKLDRCDETVKLLEKLPRLFGNLEVIEEAEKLASSNEMKMAITRVKEIYEAIEKLGYGSYISIDLGMIQHLTIIQVLFSKGIYMKLEKKLLVAEDMMS